MGVALILNNSAFSESISNKFPSLKPICVSILSTPQPWVVGVLV